MKKESILVIILGLFIFGYVLDSVSGPINMVFRSPYAFFTPVVLYKFPFTAVSILIKTIAINASLLLLFSFMEKQSYTKAIILFVLAGLSELYAIQALASGTMLIQLQWILALSSAGLLMLAFSIIFLVIGLIQGLIPVVPKKFTQTDTVLHD